ncbi:MAG: recombinase family protein [Brevinema sp.]
MAMKGMWSAGVTPFGYDRVDKKLVPNPDHAERVRKIFDLYIELRSVNAVKKRLQKLNIQTQNGRDWSDGNLYNILQRKLYLGKIEHHKEVYDGQHEAIVDKEVFHKAQQIISENRRRSASKLKGKHNSLLGGKIFDSEGWAMSPSHSVKGGRRYRYYISQAYLQKEKDKAGNLPQIPAGNTEELVSNEIRNLLKSQLANMEVGLEQGQAYKENWYKFVKDWSLLEPKIFILIRQILQKVVVSNKGLEFTIDQDNLKTIAELDL